MSEKTTDTCKAPAVGGPCILQAGHNMGYLDVPSQHRAAPEATTEANYVTLPELVAIGQFAAQVEEAAATLRKSDVSLGDMEFFDSNGDRLGSVSFGGEMVQFRFSVEVPA